MAVVEPEHAEKGMLEDLAGLVRLVEEHRVEEARRLAPELAAKWPDSRRIQRMARVLEPPTVLPSTPGTRWRPPERDLAWLREHAHEHPGCWIATFEDRLIAADPSLKNVMELVDASLDGDREVAFLHFQPAR